MRKEKRIIEGESEDEKDRGEKTKRMKAESRKRSILPTNQFARLRSSYILESKF